MPADLKPEHVEFARALVALARQHKIGSLDVTFRSSVSAIHSGPDFWNWKQMRMQWNEGRHGDTSRITLRHEAESQIDEREVRSLSGAATAPPRFEKTYCSQCGGVFGPGDQGYSHCDDHGGTAASNDQPKETK